jgi:chloramphenicol-sensitive protein RarD
MTTTNQHNTAGGLAYGLATFAIWGLTPLYFRAVGVVPPVELLCHRIVWSALFVGAVVCARGTWAELVRSLRTRRTLALLGASSLALAASFLLTIYSVSSGRVLQSSLGGFMMPLFTVLLGTWFLHERLRWGQWAALALSALGLVSLIIACGELPWLALALGGSQALYGFARKQAAKDSVVALSIEMLFLVPAAAVFLGVAFLCGTASFGGNPGLDLLLLLSILVTAAPMLMFGRAVRGLQLSTLGVMQYLTPGLQFLLAVAVFGEPFQPAQALGFGCLWVALLAFAVEGIIAQRRIGGAQPPAVAGSSSRNSHCDASTRARAPRGSVSMGSACPQSTLAKTGMPDSAVWQATSFHSTGTFSAL